VSRCRKPTSVPNTQRTGQQEKAQKRRSTRRRALITEVVIGAPGAGAVGGTDVSSLPVWAVIAFSIGLTVAAALASSAAVGPESERVLSLWLTVVSLTVLLSGTLLYANWPHVAFVNHVGDKHVPLSPEPGAPPRSNYDSHVLIAGEGQSVQCYVVAKGKTWLSFKSGWAPRSAFLLPPEAHHDLPAPC
jgi:hypothetical protein